MVKQLPAPRIRQIVALLLVGLCSVYPAVGMAAQFIRIEAEPNRVYTGDYVSIHIESSGLDADIDLEPLNRIGRFVRETLGTRLSVVSGRVVDVQVQRIVLEPTEAGRVKIDALTAGTVVSNSLELEILERSNKTWSTGADNVKIEASLDRSSPYQQAQSILSIELKYRHRMIGFEYQFPHISGAHVITLADAIRPPPHPEQPEWNRVLWRFALFPDGSGAVNIDSLHASGTLVRASHERAGFSLASEALQLLPTPPPSLEQWWLPAGAVEVAETWSGSTAELRAGDEIERTIEVQATGARASQIPDIVMPETIGLIISAYPPHRENHLDHDNVTGKAVFRFRIIALSPIPVFVDATRIHWWDTARDQSSQTLLPPRRMHIGVPDREALLQAVGKQRGFMSRWSAALHGWQSILYAFALLLTLGAMWRHRVADRVLAALLPRLRSVTLVRRIHRLVRRGERRRALRLLYQQSPGMVSGGAVEPLKHELEQALFAHPHKQK